VREADTTSWDPKEDTVVSMKKEQWQNTQGGGV
jgi:hypothetical protein